MTRHPTGALRLVYRRLLAPSLRGSVRGHTVRGREIRVASSWYGRVQECIRPNCLYRSKNRYWVEAPVQIQKNGPTPVLDLVHLTRYSAAHISKNTLRQTVQQMKGREEGFHLRSI